MVVRILQRLGRFMCAMSGHAQVLTFESQHMRLTCTHCGHVSPGWDLRQIRPKVRPLHLKDRSARRRAERAA